MHTPSSRHAEIPVVDVSCISDSQASGAAALASAAAAVREACVGSGFLYVSNHGVPTDLVAAAFEANRKVNALPEAAKLAMKLNRWYRGYQPFATSKLTSSQRFAPAEHANQLESFFIRHEVPSDAPSYMRDLLSGPNQWPDLPGFREVVTQFDRAVTDLGHRLLRLFSLAVGEESGFFDSFFAPASTCLRLIHYPPAPATRPDDLYGIHPHTDYGFLTLLVQDDVGGLQVRRPDGSWIDARPEPGTFVLNVGDALARWTNDRFNSTPHRVINASADRDRYSIAMFFDPNVDALIECVPRFANAAGGGRYAPIRYGDYYAMRLQANYPDRAGTSDGQEPV